MNDTTTNHTNSNQPQQAPEAQPPPPAPTVAKESREEESSSPGSPPSAKNSSEKAEAAAVEEDVVMTDKDSGLNSADDPMDEDSGNPATVFCIKLKQPKSNLLHKMSVPELCRTFRSVLDILHLQNVVDIVLLL